MMRRRFITIAVAFGVVSGLLVIPTVLNTERSVWGPAAAIMAAIWLVVIVASALVGARIDRERAAFIAAAEGTDLGPDSTPPPSA